jgi:hypothetical protein
MILEKAFMSIMAALEHSSSLSIDTTLQYEGAITINMYSQSLLENQDALRTLLAKLSGLLAYVTYMPETHPSYQYSFQYVLSPKASPGTSAPVWLVIS